MDIQRARQCPSFDCFNNFREYNSLKRAMEKRLSYLEYWRQNGKITLLKGERQVFGGLLGFNKPIQKLISGIGKPEIARREGDHSYLKELIERLIIISYYVMMYVLFMTVSLKTSSDNLAEWNEDYMRLPRQAAHGWSPRLRRETDDDGNIASLNDVYFGSDGAMMSSIFGSYDMSGVNPDELTAITNIYAEEIGDQPISLEYTFDWWNGFNDAIVSKDIDLMEQLLWEHHNMGMLPPYILYLKAMYMILLNYLDGWIEKIDRC